MNSSQLMVDLFPDGPRAYASLTRTKVEEVLAEWAEFEEGYQDWLDKRAAEAVEAMDKDTEYIKRYE